MNKLIAILGFLAYTGFAHAQTTFSFSGLSWGDTQPQVEAKLKTAGFKISLMSGMACKFQSDCFLDFSDPDGDVGIDSRIVGSLEGKAKFLSGRLASVSINKNYSAEERATKLIQKYGRGNPNRSGGLEWVATNGESLSLGQYGDLYYDSGVAARTEKSKNDKVQY